MSFTLHMQRPDWKQRIWDYINGKAPPMQQVRVSNGNQEPRVTAHIVPHDTMQMVMRNQ
jgi:hypothetical protein